MWVDTSHKSITGLHEDKQYKQPLTLALSPRGSLELTIKPSVHALGVPGEKNTHAHGEHVPCNQKDPRLGDHPGFVWVIFVSYYLK